MPEVRIPSPSKRAEYDSPLIVTATTAFHAPWNPTIACRWLPIGSRAASTGSLPSDTNVTLPVIPASGSSRSSASSGNTSIPALVGTTSR